MLLVLMQEIMLAHKLKYLLLGEVRVVLPDEVDEDRETVDEARDGGGSCRLVYVVWRWQLCWKRDGGWFARERRVGELMLSRLVIVFARF